jgi:hypothetical protein
MKINLNGDDFNLDVEKAVLIGALTKIPKTRPVRVSDIPNGSLFTWNGDRYVMIDNKSRKQGQCICITEVFSPYQVWFDDDTDLKYWSFADRNWISEIRGGY